MVSHLLKQIAGMVPDGGECGGGLLSVLVEHLRNVTYGHRSCLYLLIVILLTIIMILGCVVDVSTMCKYYHIAV